MDTTESTQSFSDMVFSKLDNTAITPDIPYEVPYMDADDEMHAISAFIKRRCAHNQDIEISRIKFLYSNKPKKDGGKFVAGYIIARSEIEQVVDDRYDYVICVFAPVWAGLDSKHKVIQLDKLLCGVNVEVDLQQQRKVKKNQTDVREFLNNVNYFGANEVMQSSEIVDLATVQAMEAIKEAKKNG